MFAAVLLLSAGAEPVPTFEVANKVPPFTVVNRMAVAPAVVITPSEPPPPGYRWERREGEAWKPVPLAAPAVAAPRPFPVATGTPATVVRSAVGPSSQSPGSTRTGLIRIGAGTTAPFGVIEYCPPSG